MKIISKKTIEDFHNNYVEFELETEKFGKVFVNVYEDDYNDKTPFEDTEAWVYTKSYAENSADDDIFNYEVELNHEDFKDIYDFVINS